jgi:hypothetical protein
MSSPFDRNPEVPAYQSPMPPMYPANRRSSSSCLVFGLVFGGLGLCILCCCGGLGGIAYLGLNQVSSEIRAAVENHPTFREEIGEITSFDMNFTKAVNWDDENVFVYDVTGTVGNGELIVSSTTRDDGNEEIEWAILRTGDGQTHDLIGDHAPDPEGFQDF